MSLRGEGSKQLCDVGIDVFWRTAFLAGVEEPLVVRHAVAELVYLFEFEVELRAVSSGKNLDGESQRSIKLRRDSVSGSMVIRSLL